MKWDAQPIVYLLINGLLPFKSDEHILVMWNRSISGKIKDEYFEFAYLDVPNVSICLYMIFNLFSQKL